MVRPYDANLWVRSARHEVEQKVLAGPDCPAKRFLLEIERRRRLPQRQPPVLPQIEKPMKSLMDKALPPQPAHAMMSDPEFFASQPVEEDDRWES